MGPSPGPPPAPSYRPGARRAEPRDHADLVRLAAAALEHLDVHRGGAVFRDREARRPPVAESVAEDLDAMEDGRAVVLVGQLGDVVVGYAAAHVEPTRGAPMAVVDDLFVEPAARGVGVGHALMSALVDDEAFVGCGGIQAEVLPGDRATKNFFEAFGLVARKITVHSPIAGRSDDG